MADHFEFPHSVCAHPGPDKPEHLGWATLLSSLVDLTTGEYLVAAGNPCRTPYQPLPWDLYDGPSGNDAARAA
jgi:isopenicillin-N N-acyltransferase-like protein